MKTSIVGILTFAAGVGAGWLIKPATPDPNASSSLSTEALPTKSGGERPAAPGDPQRLDGLLSQITGQAARARFDPKAAGGPTIDPADYPKLLETLQQRAGLSGLSWDDKSAFGKLLGDWYAIDPSRAANWVRTLKNPDDRRELGEVLIAAAVKGDYDEAIRLMQDFSVNSIGVVQVPESLLNAAAKRGADELLKLCSMSVGDGTSSGHRLSYPDNFDFQMALEGLNGLAGKGVKLATYPANLLDQWAARNPEAAFRWYSESGSRSHLISFQSYFSNLAESAGSDQLASKISLALTVAGGSEPLLNDIGGEIGRADPAVVAEMLAKLPEELDQTGLRAALLKTTAWAGKDGASRRGNLLGDLEPDERVALMQVVFPDKKNVQWDQASLDSLKQSLVALGHPAEQAAELIPAAPTPQQGGFGVSAGVSFGSGFIQEDSTDATESPDGE